jgi:hypothetical protein
MAVVLETTDEVVAFLADCVARAERGALPAAYGIFARAYHRFTLAIVAYSPSGVFDDPAWIADFDVRFARRYQFALENPTQRGAPWKIAFDAAERRGARAIRHMMLGINAHMSYDLCEVLLEGVVDDPVRRRRDFLAVNSVITRAVPSIQRLVEDKYGEGLRTMDLLGLNADELLTEETFTDWRGRAWDDAMQILAGRLSLPDVERRVARRARWLGLLPV